MRRGHVLGVERTGNGQRDDAGPRGRILGQGCELLHRAGRHHLAASVDVRGSEAVALNGLEHSLRVAAEHGRHAGGLHGAGRRHRLAALTDEHHRLLRGDDTGCRRSGDLADRVTGTDPDGPETVCRVVEQRQQGQQPRAHDERLRDGRVLDRLLV